MNKKNILIAVMVVLFAGLLAGVVNNAYMSRIERATSSINGDPNFKANTLSFNELDAAARKYTASVNFIAPKNTEEFACAIIEREIKLLMRNKSASELTNDDITAITSFFKEHGIIIYSILINGEKNE